MIKYKVTLTSEEREQLNEIVSKGNHCAQLFRTAYILLNCDEGRYSQKVINEEVARVLQISMRMIDRVKQRFIEEGFEACLARKPMSRTKEKKADGEVEVI